MVVLSGISPEEYDEAFRAIAVPKEDSPLAIEYKHISPCNISQLGDGICYSIAITNAAILQKYLENCVPNRNKKNCDDNYENYSHLFNFKLAGGSRVGGVSPLKYNLSVYEDGLCPLEAYEVFNFPLPPINSIAKEAALKNNSKNVLPIWKSTSTITERREITCNALIDKKPVVACFNAKHLLKILKIGNQ